MGSSFWPPPPGRVTARLPGSRRPRTEDGSALTDLAGYRLYACPVQPCTKATGAVIAQPTTTSAPILHGRQGFLFVTAVDTSGNESVESNVVPFDVLAPGGPTGVEVR